MIARFGESGKKRVCRRILKHSGHKKCRIRRGRGGVRVQKSEIGNNMHVAWLSTDLGELIVDTQEKM